MSIAQEMRLQELERLAKELAERVATLEQEKAKRDTLTLKKAPKNG